MESSKPLVHSNKSIKHYSTEKMKKAVKLILSDANVCRISWRTKTFVVNGNEIELPNLIRKQIPMYMYWDYWEAIPENMWLSPQSFRWIAKAITTQDQKIKQAVDYVSGVLMYDNFVHLKDFVATFDMADHLTGIVNGLDAFIKTTFEGHISQYSVTATIFFIFIR